MINAIGGHNPRMRSVMPTDININNEAQVEGSLAVVAASQRS